jgi:hypothetical protein
MGGTTFRLDNDADYQRNQDVLEGLEFVATLSLDTPLRVLEHHGERYRGLPSSAPKHGDESEGIWVPVVNWAGLGINPPADGMMASAIGPVPSDGGTFLPFLIEFRRIVESDLPTFEKLKQVDRFSKSTPEYQRIRRRLGADFAKVWFAKQLTVVPGIGRQLARVLFDAGFLDIDALRAAGDAELLEIGGMGPSTVKKIREYFSKPLAVE